MPPISRDVIGVIPAAGLGSRLDPYPVAKELLPLGWQDWPVDGRSEKRPKVVSQFAFESLIEAGATRMVMVINDRKADLIRYYSDGSRWNVGVGYVHQAEARGLPFAIATALPFLANATVILGLPDTVVQPHGCLAGLMRWHRNQRSPDGNGPALTLAAFPADNPQKLGMIALDSEGRVTQHEEKPKVTSMTLMWAAAIWEPEFTELLRQTVDANRKIVGPELKFGAIIDEALRRGLDVRGHHVPGSTCIDIGTPEDLATAQQTFALTTR